MSKILDVISALWGRRRATKTPSPVGSPQEAFHDAAGPDWDLTESQWRQSEEAWLQALAFHGFVEQEPQHGVRLFRRYGVDE